MTITAILLMAAATILTLLFIILLLKGKKYDEWIEPLDSKEFPLCQLYGAGFAACDIIKFDFSAKAERKRRQEMALIYGEKLAEYYLRVNAAERFTMLLLLLTLGFIMYGLAAEPMIIAVFAVFAGTAFYYVGTKPANILEEKTNQIMADFADVTSKLALLVNAGMILKEAWEKIAMNGEGELYDEMRRSVEQMNNGVPEVDAYMEFGSRCMAPPIKKFTSTIIQGMVKGNRELVEMIKEQSRELWETREHMTRQEGEKAASKLLFPICLIFVGILIIVIVPIFTNIGV